MNPTVIVPIVITWASLGVIYLLILAFRYLPNYIRKYIFRWYFHFFPESEKETELRKLQLKTCIIPELQTLAKLLNVVYEKENQNLNIITKIEHGSVNDFEGLKGNLIKIRKDIKRSERDFYRARYSAEFFGFVVPKDFKDYLK